MPQLMIYFVYAVIILGVGVIYQQSGTGRAAFDEPHSVTNSNRLRKAAQDALNAIGSKHVLRVSNERAQRGQHVFNNGLLGFDRSVMQYLLKEVQGYQQLDFLTKKLHLPLSKTVQDAIKDMKVTFREDEHYEDFNADLYGHFVCQLRSQLVMYLKAETSVIKNERTNISKIRQRVQFIASVMAIHEVYVDPMARDRWIEENGRQLYNMVRDELKLMFQNILQNFLGVYDYIRHCRSNNIWSWDKNPTPRPVPMCSS